MTNTKPHTPKTIGREARELLRDMVMGNEGHAVVDELRYTARVVDELLHQAVRDLRSGGASWTEIGMLFGCSRQAAHERFREQDD